MREVCVKKERAKSRLGCDFASEISRIEKELSNRAVDLTPNLIKIISKFYALDPF